MTSQQIKEQVIRLEGFADGFKNAANILAKWMIEELEKEKNEIPANPGETPGQNKE